MPAPRPRISDHLAVLWLLLRTIAGVVPFVLHVLISPVATPIARRRLERILSAEPRAPIEPPSPDPAAWAGKTLFVSAGEPSGDRLAARVVEAIRARAPGISVRGYAGPQTAEAGASLDRSIVEHAVVGFVAVARSLGTWWRLCAEARAIFRDDPPDVVLTVDFPGLNLRIARWARRRGIRVVHLVAPQTWAWAPWRTARLARAVDLLLVTFPFEEPVFRSAEVSAAYVGHPLFEAPLPPPLSPETLPEGDLVVELRPGSRAKEVRRQGPIVLDAAARLEERVPAARFLVRLASAQSEAVFREVLAKAPRVPRRLEIRVGPGPEGLSLAAALSTSGTSTAELAASQVPMVVFYRVSFLGRVGAALLVTTPFIAMANLLAGRALVTERLVSARGGRVLADDLAALLGDPARWRAVRDGLGEVRARLAREGVADRVARAVLAPD